MNRTHNAIYFGTVTHRRLRPVVHVLNYDVAAVLIDVDALTRKEVPSLMSYNSWNLFSIRDADHGEKDGRTISEFAWAKVNAAGGAGVIHRIYILAYPRILGYGFNPLTTYFAMDADGHTRMTIYEVHNTFGGRHCYVTPLLQAADINVHKTEKVFRVSPFNGVDGNYTLRATEPVESVSLGVALSTAEGPLLNAFFAGKRKPLSNVQLVRVFFGLPLMTLKVVVAIHWEALKLWKKGLKLHSQ